MKDNTIQGNFKYSENDIMNIKESFNISKVPMDGFYKDLLKLKVQIEKLYDENVFYLGHPLDDASYHGWSKESLDGMKEINNEICKRFKEVYSIILCGLGE